MCWFKKKKQTDAWTIEQYEARIQQEMNGRIAMQQERDACLARMGEIVNEPLEEYWNNKRPKSDIKYPARPIANKTTCIDVDPRIFFTNDPSLPNLWKGNNDDTALACQQYVIDKITYTSDKTQFTISEEWLFPYETLALKKGDCEDGAILMANLMLKAGISYWRIRLNAGDVKVSPTSPTGGHAYVTYCREKDNKWYLLDWCFLPKLNFGALYSDNENYYKIWFSLNTKYIYVDENFDKTTGDSNDRRRPKKNRRQNRSYARKRRMA